MKPLTLSLLAGMVVLVYFFPERRIARPPGILVPEEPRQTGLRGGVAWEHKGYRILPLATFSIRARVLFKERYWMGRESNLSPLDLTVGWGLMSDQAVLDQYRISRGYRRFWWQLRNGGAAAVKTEVITHSANIHIIPASDDLARSLAGLHPGNIVEMGGMLVEADGRDGWKWRSSLTRDDTGDGACELMWVEWMRAR
jgi:hypothetical protein